MNYIFIVNGREDKSSIREEVERQLESLSEKPDYQIYATRSSGDAASFVRSWCEEHPDDGACFVACGGDGTLCEVASGYMSASQSGISVAGKSVAVLALGTGNDFVKYYPGRDFTSVKALLEAEAHQIDIIKVNDHYSINVTNFGFDSVVGSTANKLAAKGWKNPYRFGIVTAILKGRFNRISVEADGEKLGGRKMLLCTLANCHYVGGEFFCAPKAGNDDGLIDVCYLRTMTLLEFLKILPVYTAGQHLDNEKFSKKIEYRQAKSVVVTAPKTVELCLDGEMLAGTRFDVSIVPLAVTLMVPPILPSC